MRRFGCDAVIALGLLVLCAELYRETYNFRVPPFSTMSTATWPRFVLILLALLSAALLAQSLWHRPSTAPSGMPSDELPLQASHRNALICFGLFAAFLVALDWLGMLLAGVAFVLIMQEAMGPRDMRSRLVHLLIAIVSVGGMWAVFTFALRVILPEGVLLRW
jgi:putative tricarboxylic transport membrane protein